MTPVPEERTSPTAPLVLRSSAFAGLPIMHGFTARIGGVSPAPFDSLNFSTSTGDNPENVRKNELRLMEFTGMGCRSMATLSQVHGNSVVFLEKDRPLPAFVLLGEGDAVVTDREDVLIGVKTADCTPILLFDPAKGVISAVHAGWRGTALKAAATAVSAMGLQFGTLPGDVRAAIGPCIGPCCYSVGGEVVQSFADAFGPGSHIVRSEGAAGWGTFADLQGANASILESAGVSKENIGSIRLCTSCNKDLFFSHRRDNGITGRHLNFIGKI